MEIWKKIKDFDNYEVSNLGNVRNIIKNKTLKPILHSTGYNVLNLCNSNFRKTIRLHKIVATHFIKNESKKDCINHINGIKTDNRACNLEWVSQSENVTHAYLKINRASKYHGVTLDKKSGKYIARVRINNLINYLGRFSNELEAYNEVIYFLKSNNIKNKYA